jgi:hypothetical protein
MLNWKRIGKEEKELGIEAAYVSTAKTFSDLLGVHLPLYIVVKYENGNSVYWQSKKYNKGRRMYEDESWIVRTLKEAKRACEADWDSIPTQPTDFDKAMAHEYYSKK